MIIPTRNRPELLQRAVASVVAQDYRPIQLVIIDNVSDTPVSVDSGDIECIIHRNTTRVNASTNRNQGVRLAAGSLISFLDDDDVYLPYKLKVLAEAMEGVDLCYGNTKMVGKDGVWLGTSYCAGEMSHVMLYRNIHTNSTLIRRKIFDKVWYDESMTTFEDVEFIFRIFREFPVRYVEQVVAIWNRDNRPDQMTIRNHRRAFRNWRLLCERFAVEINRYPRVARFYYWKMFLLAMTQWRIATALKFFGRYVLRGRLSRAAG